MRSPSRGSGSSLLAPDHNTQLRNRFAKIKAAPIAKTKKSTNCLTGNHQKGDLGTSSAARRFILIMRWRDAPAHITAWALIYAAE